MIRIFKEDNSQHIKQSDKSDTREMNMWVESSTNTMTTKDKKKNWKRDNSIKGKLLVNNLPTNGTEGNIFQSLADSADHQQNKDNSGQNAVASYKPTKVIIVGDSLTKHLNVYKKI